MRLGPDFEEKYAEWAKIMPVKALKRLFSGSTSVFDGFAPRSLKRGDSLQYKAKVVGQ
jgi:hypothetical protein